MSGARKKKNDRVLDAPKLDQPQFDYQWNKRILVVEDEPDLADIYRDILAPAPSSSNVVPLRSSRGGGAKENASQKQQEFELTICNNPREAIEVVQKARSKGQHFAMGFFDVMLGSDMDGFDLVKELNRIEPQLYSVFVTAYNDRSIDSISTYLGEDRVGHWDYLNKPFTQGEILQKARNFVALWNLQHEKTLRDVQLAELNRRLLESERLSSVAAVARGVSHEFGNILMQIMGKAELGVNKPPEEMKQALQKILEASQRAAEILDRFKGLSDNGKRVSKKEPVKLKDLLNEALDLLEPQFRKSQVKACKIKTDPVEIMGDSTALLQVFVNLSINAIHAMRDSGQIDYSIRNEGEFAEVVIRDYGPGIPKDLIDKVTDAFFTTKGKEGTGLGLSICKEIIEIEHQGHFKLKNHGVQGLEISIRLPVKA